MATAAAALNATTTKTARAAARTTYDAAVASLGALLTAEKAQVEQLGAAATTADDKLIYGQMAFRLGKIAGDNKMQGAGLLASAQSGKLAAEQAAEYSYFAGALAFEAGDYSTARTALQAASAAGYTKSDVEGMLAESYINENKPAEGLAILESAITKKGAAAPEEWLRRGEVIAYNAKMADKAAFFGSRLVAGYPTTQNWALSIAVLRDLARYPAQDMIDLLRLMDRTKSYMEGRDYIEYIEAADPRRSPGEVMKVLNAGLASGKLTAGDVTVSEARTIASGRIAGDKASLPGLERDARAASATGTIVMAAADAYLSYDQPAKAAELYQIALGKPGVDMNRALTRLGIAQIDQGQAAAAAATFAKIEGPRKPMAQLWAAYAASKGASATAAVQ